MPRYADIEDPRSAVVKNLEGIAKDSAICLDKIKNGIAGLANLVQKYPGALTEKEDKMLHDAFSPILDMIEKHPERLQALKEVADSIDSAPAPTGELFEEGEERMPAAASTDWKSRLVTKKYIRSGDYVYRRKDTPKDIPIV